MTKPRARRPGRNPAKDSSRKLPIILEETEFRSPEISFTVNETRGETQAHRLQQPIKKRNRSKYQRILSQRTTKKSPLDSYSEDEAPLSKDSNVSDAEFLVALYGLKFDNGNTIDLATPYQKQRLRRQWKGKSRKFLEEMSNHIYTRLGQKSSRRKRPWQVMPFVEAPAKAKKRRTKGLKLSEHEQGFLDGKMNFQTELTPENLDRIGEHVRHRYVDELSNHLNVLTLSDASGNFDYSIGELGNIQPKPNLLKVDDIVLRAKYCSIRSPSLSLLYKSDTDHDQYSDDQSTEHYIFPSNQSTYWGEQRNQSAEVEIVDLGSDDESVREELLSDNQSTDTTTEEIRSSDNQSTQEEELADNQFAQEEQLSNNQSDDDEVLSDYQYAEQEESAFSITKKQKERNIVVANKDLKMITKFCDDLTPRINQVPVTDELIFDAMTELEAEVKTVVKNITKRPTEEKDKPVNRILRARTNNGGCSNRSALYTKELGSYAIGKLEYSYDFGISGYQALSGNVDIPRGRPLARRRRK